MSLIKNIYIVVLLATILSGCISSRYEAKFDKSVKDYFRKEYFQMSENKRYKKFKSYSLDKQYEIFMFANLVVHPPLIHFADFLAEQRGEILVPFLSKKLKETEDEVIIRNIFLVFSALLENKSYNFSENPKLLSLLEEKVNNMQGIWKDITFEMFLDIKK